MAGKGDKRRPAAVKDDELEERWAAAFGRRKRNPNRAKKQTHEHRDDGRIERLCIHGVGHPTPASCRKADRAWGWEPGTASVHGCDECCLTEDFFSKKEQ